MIQLKETASKMIITMVQEGEQQLREEEQTAFLEVEEKTEGVQ